MEDMFIIQDELFGKDLLDCHATKIPEAKYEWTDVADVVNKLTNLNAHQEADLLKVLHGNRWNSWYLPTQKASHQVDT